MLELKEPTWSVLTGSDLVKKMSLFVRKSLQEQPNSATVEEKIVKVNGDIAYRKYTRGRFLGKGGFAKVYEITNQESGKVSAAKLISKASLAKARARQKLMSEIKIHRSLHHENVVLFEHFFEDADNVYILLEMCPNQSLSEMMRRRKRVTELEAQCYMYQVVTGMRYLHMRRIINRDIKLGNLFLDEKMQVKIGDFGLAAKLEFDGERKRTICGTPNYIAPEILEGHQGHSYEVDVWSIGVLLYTFVVGKPPFETNDIKTTYRRIRMNAYSFPEHVPLSEDVKNLISSILITDPTARPTLDQILSHPFFSTAFPTLLPLSCLAVPPSATFTKQYSGVGRQKKPSTPRGMETPEKTKPKLKRLNTERLGSPPSSPRPALGSARKTTTVSLYTPVGGSPRVWVKKWVDYSSKYGLGYVLSNGSVGVYFNDSTKIVSSSSTDSFQYTSRPRHAKDEETQEYVYANYPAELNKKVTLLEHFRKHLGEDSYAEGADNYVYIKRWLTTCHATIFRLSNKVVQVCFQDKTEMILCSTTKQVAYVCKSGDVTVSPLKAAAENKNSDLAKRLKYTKEILTQLIAGQTGHTSNPTSNPTNN